MSTKPNREQILRLQKIVDTPHGTTAALQGEDRDLLYIFRYSLTDNKRALTKVLMSIDWDVTREVAEVGPLLDLWRSKAPIDLAEALKLLGKERAFQDERVRQYAIDILNTASDEEVNLFLLQLVQALRHEPTQALENVNVQHTEHDMALRRKSLEDQSDLVAAAQRATIGDFSDDEGEDIDTESAGANSSINADRYNDAGENARSQTSRGADAFLQSLVGSKPSSPLAAFLIDRACRSRAVANALYWFLKVEAETDVSGLFRSNLNALLYALYSQKDTVGESRSLLAKQLYCLDKWIENITECQRDARENSLRPMFKDKYAHIQETLNGLFIERGLTIIPEGLPSFPNPLDTSQSILGLNRCSHIFKSAMVPCVVDVTAVLEPTTGVDGSPDQDHGSRSASMLDEDDPHSVERESGNKPLTHAMEHDRGGDGAAVAEDEGDEEDEENWGMEAGDLVIGDKERADSTNRTLDALAVGDPISSESMQQAHAILQKSNVKIRHSNISSRSANSNGLNLSIDSTGTTAESHRGLRHQFTEKLFFKQGDDLRTDQLILNLFSLMDSLLKKVNLDLRMRVYSVLATTQKDGIMEFVDKSLPVQAILDRHNKSIRNYLRKYNPDPHSPIGIAPDVLETFIRSCAGSCVCTYILGIGDRHLDNIMITQNGQLFHIDFGFVFGKDPKPLPSPSVLREKWPLLLEVKTMLIVITSIDSRVIAFKATTGYERAAI